MNDIQTILILSKNPHYTLSDEELAALRQYQFQESQKNEVQEAINKNQFKKNNIQIPVVS